MNCQKFMNMHEINKYALNGLGIMNMHEWTGVQELPGIYEYA